MSTILEAINWIMSGIDPITGEVFDKAVLSEDPEISLAITRLAISTQKHLKVDKKLWTWPETNPNSELIFQMLKEWRLEQAHTLGVPAYIIFTDVELQNLSEATITAKEDLLFVRGIAHSKYEAYGDELFALLSNYMADIANVV